MNSAAPNLSASMIVKNTGAFLHDTTEHIVKITIAFGNFYIYTFFFTFVKFSGYSG